MWMAKLQTWNINIQKSGFKREPQQASSVESNSSSSLQKAQSLQGDRRQRGRKFNLEDEYLGLASLLTKSKIAGGTYQPNKRCRPNQHITNCSVNLQDGQWIRSVHYLNCWVLSLASAKLVNGVGDRGEGRSRKLSSGLKESLLVKKWDKNAVIWGTWKSVSAF